MAQGKNTSGTEIKRTNDPKNSSRRRAVKTIAGGVSALAAYHVLPINWSKPVVEQVFLPAHAAVSGITLSNPCNVELVSGNQASSIDVIRVSGFVTPPVGGLDVAIVALPNGGTGGQVDVFTTTNADGTYSAEVTMVGGPGIIGVGVGTATAGVGNISGCAIGLPPAETPKPNQPTTQPPSTTPAPTTTPSVTLTFIGGGVPCGNDLRLDSGGGFTQNWRVQLAPPPSSTQALAVETTLERGGSIVQSDTLSGITVRPSDGTSPVFSQNFSSGTVQVGDIYRCRVTDPVSGATAECINPIVA